MTDEHTTHLDDEALSAAHDGELDAAAAAHLRGCGHCSARLERIAAVATLVATPVAAPSAEVRERTLANALAAFDEAGAADDASGGVDGSVRHLARRRRGSPAPWFLGVAAALLLVVGIGAFGGRLEGGGDASESGGDVASMSSDTLGTDDDVVASEQAPALDAPPGEVVDGGDLGPIDDVAALQRAVAAPAEETLRFQRDGSGRRDDLGGSAPGSASGQGDEALPSPSAGTAAADAPPACGDALARLLAAEGPLRVRASASFEGRPAVVYGFDPEADGGALRFVVVTLDDCGAALTTAVAAGG